MSKANKDLLINKLVYEKKKKGFEFLMFIFITDTLNDNNYVRWFQTKGECQGWPRGDPPVQNFRFLEYWKHRLDGVVW